MQRLHIVPGIRFLRDFPDDNALFSQILPRDLPGVVISYRVASERYDEMLAFSFCRLSTYINRMSINSGV